MKKLVRAVCLTAVACALAAPAWAQHPLSGSWELYSQKENGEEKHTTSHPAHRLIMVFDAEGHLAWLNIPANRPKMTKKMEDMSREELLGEFRGVGGGFVSCVFAGDRITFKEGVSIRTEEDDDPGYTFQVDGDVLTFRQEHKGDKIEIRYRRLK